MALWGSLNILREARAEQARGREDFSSARPAGAKQKITRRVHPLRRIFVTISEQSSGGQDSADSSSEEFLEVPYNSFFEVLGILKPFFQEGFKPPEARSSIQWFCQGFVLLLSYYIFWSPSREEEKKVQNEERGRIPRSERHARPSPFTISLQTKIPPSVDYPHKLLYNYDNLGEKWFCTADSL